MPAGRVRIISGQWRSRRLRVPPGVRPTQDAQRETLFNVLPAPDPATRCLDLYAGTGSLGFEALSRGAATVTFVDHSARVCATLRAATAELGAGDRATVARRDALAWLGRAPRQPYDLAFADPPYATSNQRGWWQRFLATLRPHLAAGALVCLEAAAQLDTGPAWLRHASGKNGAAHWGVYAPADA